jgi:hypothetical protein
LVECSAPDFKVNDGVRLDKKLEGGGRVLVDFSKSVVLRYACKEERFPTLDYVGVDAKGKCGLRSLLIRPDGIVAWTHDEGHANMDVLEAALNAASFVVDFSGPRH